MDWRDSSRMAANPSASGELASTRKVPPRRRPWHVWLIWGCFGVLIVIGAVCGALGGMAVGVYQFVFHEPTVSAETLRTFTVQGEPQVIVTNPAGSVTFAPGDDGEVRIEATSSARDRTEDDARKALDSISLNLSQDGETVNIAAHFNGQGSAWPGASRLINLLVTVPVKTSATVRQSAGNATVGALTGPLSLHVDAGNIHVTGATIEGSSVVQVGAGNISMDGALTPETALDLRIDAGNATITLPAATSAHIEAMTHAGNVFVHGWSISTRHTTGATLLAAGDTQSSPQARLTVEVDAGDITIQSRGSGDRR